jgi:hypothetical protein
MSKFNRASPRSVVKSIGGILAALVVSIAGAEPTFGPQSSALNVDWDFDFVETFDGLQDWVRNDGAIGNVSSVESLSKLPKLADGSESAWGYYSMWSTRTQEQSWIGVRDGNKAWRGDKSLAIDLGGRSGPSRLGLFMGDGYKEFYLFKMVNIPKNEWPTSCEGGACQSSATGIYTEGENYTWFSSWKFIAFNMGCASDWCVPYGPNYHQIAHIKKYNYGDYPGLTMHLESADHNNDTWGLGGDKNLNGYVGDWMGVEYHIKQTATQTIWDIWVYDRAGNAMKVIDTEAYPTPSSAQSQSWNQVVFGGNNSATYKWGDTMESVYYIDDVIVDDKRIGPKYFAYIQGDLPPTPPLPPSNFSVNPGY